MRYVALGSSMAAGPGIPPRARGSNFRASRSENNYPHLLARQLGFDLVDVTYSGATTAHLLTERQNGVPPQVEALDGSEGLVTITAGGNDVGYIPALLAAGVPRVLRTPFRHLLDRDERAAALDALPEKLRDVARAVRSRSPRARVVWVDYLTLLPPAGGAEGISAAHLELGLYIAERLADITAEVAEAEACDVLRASRASRDHHPWSQVPWTNGPGLPIPGRPMPFHPNARGMRAVAELLADHMRE